MHGQELLKNLNLEKIKFIRAEKQFHDRFIFLNNIDKVTGYQIGTSLNSFGTNYSNIIKLNDNCAKEIFKILHEDIVTEHILKLSD